LFSAHSTSMHDSDPDPPSTSSSLGSIRSRRAICSPRLIPTHRHPILIIHPLFSCPRSSAPELTGAHCHNLILTVARLNVQNNGHPEFRLSVRGGEFRGRYFDGLDGEDVDLLVFLVEPALVQLFEWLNVKFIFALDVFDVFLYFEEVGGKGGPALGLQNGP